MLSRREKPHERFSRERSELVTKQKIPLVEALTNSGGKRTIEGLDGKKMEVSLPSAVIKPGLEIRVSGERTPIRKDG